MMLSRIADSLFWIGRYMERADNTARILDVNYHMLLEQPADTYQLRWDPLITITGERTRFYQMHEEANAHAAFDFLGYSEDNPNSIAQCIIHARENARTIRDRISRELWEDINGLYHKINKLRDEGVSDLSRFCDAVKRGGHRFHGVCDATLPRDEGWHFLQAGCAIERAEMTARILDVHYHQLLEGPQIMSEARHAWMAVLKSVAAYELYKRHYTQIEPEKVAELLLLDARHPRSVRFNLGVLQNSLYAISGSVPGSYANEGERLTGRAYERLAYDSIGEIFEGGLHEYLEELQGTCRTIGVEVTQTYFYYAVAS